MKIKIIFTIISILSSVLILSGCYSSNALSTYPDFIVEKDKITSISLIADVVVFSDGWEDDKIVDIPKSEEIAATLLDTLRGALKSKFYSVDKVYPPLSGYFIYPPSKPYMIYYTKEDYDKPLDSLKWAPTPFKFEDGYLDTFALAALRNRGKIRAAESGDHKCLLVFSIISNDVSGSKSFVEIFLTTLFTLGAVTAYEVSDTQAYYWLIDADTGKLLIHDSRYIKNQDADKDNIADIMNDFLEAIPGKYNCM